MKILYLFEFADKGIYLWVQNSALVVVGRGTVSEGRGQSSLFVPNSNSQGFPKLHSGLIVVLTLISSERYLVTDHIIATGATAYRRITVAMLRHILS